MRYCKGQRLKSDRVFIVAETPDTYSAFGKPAYLLRTGVLISDDEERIVGQADAEDRSKYVPMLPYLPAATVPLFGRMCLIREKNTKIVSIVVGMPADHRVADSFEPAYLIQGPDALRWAIAQNVIEDGSYEVVEQSGRRDCDAS